MTAHEFAVLLRSWDAPLGLLKWLDEYLAETPNATAIDAIAAMPDGPVGKQGWYWWLDNAVYVRLSAEARETYYLHETAHYLRYITVFEDETYDRDRHQTAFARYKARMASVLVGLLRPVEAVAR
jgi:hypothetical protein